MSELKLLIEQAQQGDEKSIENLLTQFKPLINHYSYLFGEKNEDLQSELILSFLKCIRNFSYRL